MYIKGIHETLPMSIRFPHPWTWWPEPCWHVVERWKLVLEDGYREIVIL